MVKSLDHVCILVNDIDRAIEKYKNILGICAPGVTQQNKYEAFAGNDKYLSVLFTASGDGCNIQLMQPVNPDSPLYRRLEKYGEHIHHLAFTSTQLENTLNDLKEKGVTLHSDELIYNVNDPSLRWNWIVPRYANGALIEVMDEPDS